MSLKNNDLKELIIFLSVILLAMLIFSFVLFGFTGVRVVIGIIFISIPFYFMLNNFGLNEGEKFVFSALLGFTLFPSLAYLLGLVISFRIAIAAAFMAFVGIAIVLMKYKNLKKAA
ncbi:hypothetical protein J4480_02860 [Candidatus Woesearchaeota archaeon]|nr:hypothetical protein [Candidatus Woesearchaeota archaeon]